MSKRRTGCIQLRGGRKALRTNKAAITATLKRMALLINDLRAAGIAADMSYGDRGLKGAMKGADRAGARFALVLGESELADGQVQVKDLGSHDQAGVALDEVVAELGRRLT